MDDLMVVILAAGKGTRMQSRYNKMIHKLAGRPLIDHVIEGALDLSDKVVCVVGHQARQVKGSITRCEAVEFVQQDEQKGTAHAVWQAEDYISSHRGQCLILYGDTPLIRQETLMKMIDIHRKREAGMTMLTSRLDDPTGYGRIVRDEEGEIREVVEEHDADDDKASINEINAGIYCYESELLLKSLGLVDNDNAQDEYYLPETIAHIKEVKPLASCRAEPDEIIGINDRQDLARAENILQERIRSLHMKNGVTLIDPERIYIEKDVEIASDVTIYPGTVIRAGSIIGPECYIGPNCQLDQARLGREVEVKQGSFIIASQIGDEVKVGPYAHLRPGNEVGKGAKIGNFVELKKSSIGEESKVPHLSYVGDGSMGRGCNIGAGTIFANYDGENKHRTELGDEVFIGSNTTLVAPVKLGDGASTGAGSVVTDDVEERSVVLGVPARFHKKKR